MTIPEIIEDFLKKIDPEYYWVFIFASSLIENFFPPYPGDTITVLGGYLMGIGKLSMWSLASAVFLGSVSGAATMYFFGQRMISFLTQKFRFGQSFLDQGSMEKTEQWFRKYGVYAVIFSRFSAAIRFFVAIIAGATHMNFFAFLFCFSLATVLFNGVLIFGGFMLGENWAVLLEYFKIYNQTLMVILVAVLASFGLYKYFQRKKKS